MHPGIFIVNGVMKDKKGKLLLVFCATYSIEEFKRAIKLLWKEIE
jgi:hypothetical protein